MKHLAAITILVFGFSVPVFAGIAYTQDGRVVDDGIPYAGSELTGHDAPFALVAGVGVGLLIGGVSEAGALAIFPAAVIAWGAYRTSLYRPQSVKDQIHAHLATQQHKAGTISEILQ